MDRDQLTDNDHIYYGAPEAVLDASSEPCRASFRWRYFQRGRGPMFAWATTPVEGKFGSFVMKPVGPGSRSGKAEQWDSVLSTVVEHRRRKDAKARALRLFQKHLEASKS
ncbi:MAG: hypothetical protein ACREMY_18815 [bacterium]